MPRPHKKPSTVSLWNQAPPVIDILVISHRILKRVDNEAISCIRAQKIPVWKTDECSHFCSVMPSSTLSICKEKTWERSGTKWRGKKSWICLAPQICNFLLWALFHLNPFRVSSEREIFFSALFSLVQNDYVRHFVEDFGSTDRARELVSMQATNRPSFVMIFPADSSKPWISMRKKMERDKEKEKEQVLKDLRNRPCRYEETRKLLLKCCFSSCPDNSANLTWHTWTCKKGKGLKRFLITLGSCCFHLLHSCWQILVISVAFVMQLPIRRL